MLQKYVEVAIDKIKEDEEKFSRGRRDKENEK